MKYPSGLMNTETLSLRQSVKLFKEKLCLEFTQNASITSVSHRLVTFIDQILVVLFEKHKLTEGGNFCLLALGSYGRRELLLHSDIDLLILYNESIDKADLQRAQLFTQDCWDIGLEVSHQITTVSLCATLASQDLSVISSILDAHLLCGKNALMEDLLYQTHPLHMWSSHDYFFEKQKEQDNRYKKYGETAYNLEPNVKHGPGGLRDLQTLSCISKRHFGIKNLADVINFGFITDKEYEEFIHCQHFLWRVRFALHMLSQKSEERLLFEYQVKLATLFGYHDNSSSLGIEQFMKAYFKIIKRSRELNEMLLQWFAEVIVYSPKQKLTTLDNDFQLSNHYIEVRHSKVFTENPLSLLKLFLWIAKRQEIKGVRASTIRLIREHLYLINQRFCSNLTTTSLFMDILKTAKDPYRVLQRMSRYGVLGHYLDCFSSVIGQMQYDLFHVYTVDQHTLFVIRNLVRFLKVKYKETFSLCSVLMPHIKNKDILYLAALFHDIAKGRGGDHSELGAIEASHFATRHRLSTEETTLLVWLVRHHLLMSQTAQRKDIYDPKTIANFCSLLPKSSYLDYLYLLTVADICGTNPTLWNSWKDSLLKELYYAAKHAMEQEKAIIDENSMIASRRKAALNTLIQENFSKQTIDALWTHFDGSYFLHEPSEVIAMQTKAILSCESFPLVLIMPHHSQGGTEVFIYMPHRDDRFTITTTILSNHYVTIQEATIFTTDNQYDLDTYIILDEKNQAFLDKKKTDDLQRALTTHLALQTQLPTVTKRRMSKTQAHFNLKPVITFSEENERSCLFIISIDRPGLLGIISRILSSEGIYLHNAKIATAGERAEDMFYISNAKGNKLLKKEQNSLRKKIKAGLTNSL